MAKRILISGLIAIIVAILIMVFVFQRRPSFQEAQPAQAVSASSILFLENIDYQYLANDFPLENQLWRSFLKYSEFQRVDTLLYTFNQKIKQMPLLLSQFNSEALSISVHLVGNRNLGIVALVNLGKDLTPNDIEKEIKGVLPGEAMTNVRKYEAVDLIDVSFSAEALINGFTYAIVDGLLLVGSSSILIEDAIRTLHSDSGIAQQQGFQQVANTAGKYVVGNIYVNYSQIAKLFYPFVSNSNRSLVNKISEFAGWGEFDLDTREDVFLFNGMTMVIDSLPGWLNLFRDQSPVKTEIVSMVPANTLAYVSAGISDHSLFKDRFTEELKKRDEYHEFIARDKKLKKILGVSPFDQLLDLMNDELTWFVLDQQGNRTFEEVVMLKVRSRSEVHELLKGWVSTMSSMASESEKNYISSFVLDQQISYDIFTFPDELYEQQIVRRFLRKRFAIYDNYLIFSDSEEAISRTIYQNVLHKTLVNESSFETINPLLSTRSNFSCFLRPVDFILWLNDYLDEKTKKILERMEEDIRKIPGVIIQFVAEEDLFFGNVSLKFTSSLKEKALTVWESLLDSVAITKPYLVTNHYTSEKEILVQDASNTLSLINSTGRILWSTRLEGPILSDIEQVDYYKNGKLQYIFNTASGIHLIDRNGNYVERYPIKLRSDATNGMVLFDYDKKKDYRIFVACTDRRIYVYDLEGNIVPGWSFRKTEGIVTKPIQHFRVGDKDYIIFSDRIRTYILNRQGKDRISLKDPLVVSENNMFYLDMNISGAGPRFVTTDTSGNIAGIRLNGKVETILPYEASSGHYFRSIDLDQDGQIEFIFADDNELEVLDNKGKRLFTHKIKADICNLPDIYEFSSSDLKIGLTDIEKNLIYLLNSDGTVYEGFPLEGSTRYSIGYFAGSDSRFNLVVGSQTGFLYNYSIE